MEFDAARTTARPTTAADLPPGTTPAEAETVLTRSQRTITVEVTPTPDSQVNVWVDFHDGTGPHQELSAPAPEPIPQTYKFGFASSTGLFTDVHLIRTVTVSTVRPLPRLELDKQVDKSTPLPPVLTAGDKIPYQFVVTNSGGSPVNNLVVTDPLVTNITCPQRPSPPVTPWCVRFLHDHRRRCRARLHGRPRRRLRHRSRRRQGGVPALQRRGAARRQGGLELDKQVDAAKTYRVGDMVEYSYVVTNVSDKPVGRLHRRQPDQRQPLPGDHTGSPRPARQRRGVHRALPRHHR